MRLSIVFVSSALIFAGLNAAYPVSNDLATRTTDSDALAEFSARAFEAESELYARGFWSKSKKSKEQGNQGPEGGGDNTVQKTRSRLSRILNKFKTKKKSKEQGGQEPAGGGDHTAQQDPSPPPASGGHSPPHAASANGHPSQDHTSESHDPSHDALPSADHHRRRALYDLD